MVGTRIIMGDTTALIRLLTWLSPAFPVGAFAYSAGLEQAVADRIVTNRQSLSEWLTAVLTHGGGWNDAVLLAESHAAGNDGERLREANALALALPGSRERFQETVFQGQAFLSAAAQWPSGSIAALDGDVAYPVAVGSVAAMHDVALGDTLAAYLHALVSNAVSAGIRLSVIGQTDGLTVLSTLETLVRDSANRAARSTLDDLGSAAIVADICSLRHEILPVRLFRS